MALPAPKQHGQSEAYKRVPLSRVLNCFPTIPLGQPGPQLNKNCTSALNNKGARGQVDIRGDYTN